MKKQYTIKGTGCPEYGKNIIKFFEQLRAVNKYIFDGTSAMRYYYINEDNELDFLRDEIPLNHTEIELLPNGMAKGVWYKDDGGDFIKPKKIKEETEVHGETIYASFDHIKFYKKDWWCESNFKTATPLTDLTEIQPYLPDGHEDKQPDKDFVNYLVPEAKQEDELDKGIFIDYDKMEIYGFTTIKEAIERLQKLIQ
jgi:hypothetical protein